MIGPPILDLTRHSPRKVHLVVPAMIKSVLVVDDNPAIRQVICEIFTSAGFHVCNQAANGQEAIDRAQQLRPHLIVMDLSMPVMDGLQAATILRTLLPSVPIILFSEYSPLLTAQDMRSRGVTALI